MLPVCVGLRVVLGISPRFIRPHRLTTDVAEDLGGDHPSQCNNEDLPLPSIGAPLQ